MDYVLIIHKVKDYPAWKRVFDGAADMRKAAGERWYQVLADKTDLNRIVHYSQWESTIGARAFFESAELVEIRKKAGVEAPEFIYLGRLEEGVL